MKSKLIAAAAMLATAAVATPAAAAASGFDGTWKFDVKSQQVSTKPSVYALTGGQYSCSTCVPAYTIPADGAFHKVAGNPYYDEVAVKTIDATSIKWSSRKAGKAMADNTRTVAPGGKSMAIVFHDMTATNGVAVTGHSTVMRVAAGPAGSHATSGSWVDTPSGDISDAGLLVTMKTVGKAMTLTTPTGITYTATIDGPQAPVTGDPGWTTVALAAPKPATLVETDYRAGKPITITTSTLAADGKTMFVMVDDLLHQTKAGATLIKQ